ncbi:serine/threonine-protein kinase [Streptomyces sp. NPDC058657]|uniref:serine/threonine-protein kinase n=1 Tax=unclassified Streptomyces TaxID=2593676 RepID=UPI003652F2CE
MWGRGTVLGGRYTLGERIGGGAMGEVWRAEDGVLERSVAVKILLPKLLEDPHFAARFRREAKVLASLGHPGIVDVHDYGEESAADEGTGRIAYIVMELVDGRPLDEVREDEGPMPVARALDLVAQALDALHTAHRGGIVHRDIKPSNLMLRGDGRVTVTDFGIAHSKAASRLTASHAVLGTALYIAPEQAEGTGTVPASDLYSMGVVAYELLTGEPPFNGETVLEIVLKHIREPAPQLPGSFPAPVRAFVARALAKMPEERFADAAVMAAAARAAGAVGAAGAGTAGTAAGEAAPGPVPVPVPDPVVQEPSSPPVVAPPVVAPPVAEPPTPAPSPAPAPVPLLVSGPATAGSVPLPWWKRLPRPVLVVVPVVLTAAATVTVINILPPGTEARAGSPQPAASAPAPAGQTPGGPLPAAPHSTPGAGGSPAADKPAKGADAKGGKDTPATGGTGKGKPGAAATGPGADGNAASKGNGSGASGGNAGSGSGSGTKPKPPPAGPAKPENCGGDNWGAITNVGSGRRMGLSGTDPSGSGGTVVSGGNTQFGWVSGGNQFAEFHACNLAGGALGLKSAPAYNEKTGVVLAASTGYSGYVTSWKTTPTGGAHQINYYVGDGCVTDNGAGRQLTVDPCTPGNKHQLWRLP